VFTQGEGMPGVFVVIQGALKVFRTDGRGKVQVIDILQPGTCVGEVQVFDGGLAASGAEAHGDTECWLIPAMPLRLMAARNNAVAMCLIQHFAGKIRHLISLVETLSLHSVPERVAQLILEYQGRNPGRALVEFRETQEDLAQCIGASREAFSRALRLLADLGLIQSTFPVVRILDIQKLQRYARG
jgi:CRP/FNR family transcriptional regulator